MATRGDAGDAPILKQAGSAASYTGGDHPEIQSGEPKILSGKYVGVGPMLAASGDYPEIQSGVVAKIRSGKYVGVGPMLAASGDHPEIQSGVEAKIQSGKYVGVVPMLAARGFAGVDTIVAARYFSSIYHQAVKPPVLIHVPRTVQLPVVLQSPREHRIVTLFQNYMRRARALGEEKVIALLDKREDRAEKKKLDAERLKFEEEKKKFEEEKMKFEEYKKQFPQKAVVVEAEKKETMPALIASKIDTAEKHVSLFEKVINAPTKAEQIVKTIQENAQVVDKRLEKFDTFQKVKKFIVSCRTGAIMFFKDEIKEFTGIRAGDSSEGSVGGESNGMSNEGKSGGPVPKAVAAANGAVNGATSVSTLPVLTLEHLELVALLERTLQLVLVWTLELVAVSLHLELVERTQQLGLVVPTR